MNSPLLKLADLCFAWPGQPELLNIPELTLNAGERLFLRGPSGSGKTTLLGLLGGVQLPQSGTIELLGQNLSALSAAARDRFRGNHSGFIFQQFNLMPFLSVAENIELPCHFSPLRKQRACARHGNVNNAIQDLLARLGLPPAKFLKRRTDELSVGQQQRVAAARALIGQPELVIADEATSALDCDTRHAFIELLFEQCQLAGAGLLFVSHDHDLAPLFDRSLSLNEINLAGHK